MNWLLDCLRSLHPIMARSPVLTSIVVVDVVAYFLGMTFWYGPVMGASETPIWAWVFIPDCPLFGLLGGLGLLMVVGQNHWSAHAKEYAQRSLMTAGALATLLWLSTYIPGAMPTWSQQSAMFGLLGWALLLCGALFQRTPRWLLSIFAFGQIKYGIWTVAFWLLIWRNSALAAGAPSISAVGVLMTVSHIGLAIQGLLLLSYFTPDLFSAIISIGWFGLSVVVDYGLGYYPPNIESYVSLVTMQWITIVVTALLGIWILRLAIQYGAGRRFRSGVEQRTASLFDWQ